MDYLKFSKIHAQIAAAQAEVGAHFGCLPWDWQAYMGGEGGSYGWAHHMPVLMGADLTHITMDGYKRSGTALAVSLGWAGPDQSVYPR
jgi:lysophospholipase L1-like esterase